MTNRLLKLMDIASYASPLLQGACPFQFPNYMSVPGFWDVYSMHGNLAKARRAVELAREEIDTVYGPSPAAKP